jgi:hypothetical protein
MNRREGGSRRGEAVLWLLWERKGPRLSLVHVSSQLLATVTPVVPISVEFIETHLPRLYLRTFA